MISFIVYLVLGVFSLSASSAFAEDDCCGPKDSSCCPGDLISGGAMGIAVEIAEDVNEENQKPASDNYEEMLGKLLFELMKALGAGPSDPSAFTNTGGTATKPTFTAWKIEALHAGMAKLKKGSVVTGKSDQGGQFRIVVKKAKKKPFVRQFKYKASSKAKPVMVTYKKTAKGISVKWKALSKAKSSGQ
jgi:hypothetical protein